MKVRQALKQHKHYETSTAVQGKEVSFMMQTGKTNWLRPHSESVSILVLQLRSNDPQIKDKLTKEYEWF